MRKGRHFLATLYRRPFPVTNFLATLECRFAFYESKPVSLTKMQVLKIRKKKKIFFSLA